MVFITTASQYNRDSANTPDLLVNGSPDRNVPGCAACHGQTGEEGYGQAPFIPKLAG